MFKELSSTSINTLKNSFAADWYYSHSSKDQKIINYLLLLIVMSLLGIFCIKPVIDWNIDKKSSAVTAYRVFNTIHAASDELKKTSSETSLDTANEVSIIPLITKTASIQNIQLNRLQPDLDTSVTVFLENQSFNVIIHWIGQLQENNQIKVTRANIESDESTKLVSAQITFLK